MKKKKGEKKRSFVADMCRNKFYEKLSVPKSQKG